MINESFRKRILFVIIIQKKKIQILFVSLIKRLSTRSSLDKILTRRSEQISLARATRRAAPRKAAHWSNKADPESTRCISCERLNTTERSTNRGRPRYRRNNATTRARVFNCFRSCPPSFSFLRNVSLSCLLPAR